MVNVSQPIKNTNFSNCYLKLRMQFVAKKQGACPALDSRVLNRNPPKPNQTGFFGAISSSIKVRQTFKWTKKKKEKILLFKKCAASTFILEMVLLAARWDTNLCGWHLQVGRHRRLQTASATGRNVQATIARYGCSNCSQLSAEPFCLPPSKPPSVTLGNPN